MTERRVVQRTKDISLLRAYNDKCRRQPSDSSLRHLEPSFRPGPPAPHTYQSLLLQLETHMQTQRSLGQLFLQHQ